MHHWFKYYWQVQAFVKINDGARLVAWPYGLSKSKYGVFIQKKRVDK